MADEGEGELSPEDVAAAKKLGALEGQELQEPVGPVAKTYPDEEVDPAQEQARAEAEDRPETPGRYQDSPPRPEGPQHKK